MNRAGEGGFTLLELIVALAVVALLAALAVPRLAGALPGASLDAGVRDLQAGLREARSLALSRNRPVRVVLDGGTNSYRIGAGGSGGDLPSDVDVTLYTGTSEVEAEDRAAIRFFPDGSSTGGRIELSGRGGKRAIVVDWLTGRITLAE